MILYLVFAAVTAVYQALYLAHCIKSRQTTAAVGTAVSAAAALGCCVLLASALK